MTGNPLQNLHESVVVDEELYGLELIQHFHLNALRPRPLPDLRALDCYPSTGHAAPEAMAGGLVGAIETGDLVYLDFRRGRIDLLDRAKSLGAAAPRAACRARHPPPPHPGPAHRGAERALTRDPSIRALLDTLSSTTEGCVPVGMLKAAPR